MILTIILTFTITLLSILVLMLRNRCRQHEKEIKRLLNDNSYLRRELERINMNDTKRRINRAYSRGLEDGRETDAIYKQILRKVSRGEQADIILNGRAEVGI